MHLGYDVSWATMARVLTKAGIEPAPKRGMGMTKAEFLESHWSLMVATDFFTAEVWLAQGLIHDCVSFVIGLTTREVKIVGIVSEPNDDRIK